jgi:hypothetical protein
VLFVLSGGKKGHFSRKTKQKTNMVFPNNENIKVAIKVQISYKCICNYNILYKGILNKDNKGLCIYKCVPRS